MHDSSAGVPGQAPACHLCVLTVSGLTTYAQSSPQGCCICKDLAAVREALPYLECRSCQLVLLVLPCCRRCYEVQCLDGAVVANHSADGQDMPLSLAAANPPYTFNTTTSQDAVEDDGRQFPGNVGAGDDLLVVQCWNATVSLNPCKHETKHAMVLSVLECSTSFIVSLCIYLFECIHGRVPMLLPFTSDNHHSFVVAVL